MKTAISVFLALGSMCYIGPVTGSLIATVLSVYAVGSMCELAFDLSGRQDRLKRLEEENRRLKEEINQLNKADNNTHSALFQSL